MLLFGIRAGSGIEVVAAPFALELSDVCERALLGEFSVIMAQFRLGIVTWFEYAVFAIEVGSLSNMLSKVSSVLPSK